MISMMTTLAGDLLVQLSRSMQKILPKIGNQRTGLIERIWRTIILIGVRGNFNFRKNPILAGESASNLGIRKDLERRPSREISEEGTAFIMDEVQDNSLSMETLQTVGREKSCKTNPTSRHPWQPTICYVGDIKQSITRLDKLKL